MEKGSVLIQLPNPRGTVWKLACIPLHFHSMDLHVTQHCRPKSWLSPGNWMFARVEVETSGFFFRFHQWREESSPHLLLVTGSHLLSPPPKASAGTGLGFHSQLCKRGARDLPESMIASIPIEASLSSVDVAVQLETIISSRPSWSRSTWGVQRTTCCDFRC